MLRPEPGFDNPPTWMELSPIIVLLGLSSGARRSDDTDAISHEFGYFGRSDRRTPPERQG
jgi:hypothetical protein